LNAYNTFILSLRVRGNLYSKILSSKKIVHCHLDSCHKCGFLTPQDVRPCLCCWGCQRSCTNCEGCHKIWRGLSAWGLSIIIIGSQPSVLITHTLLCQGHLWVYPATFWLEKDWENCG
jgi:hypothetical protein